MNKWTRFFSFQRLVYQSTTGLDRYMGRSLHARLDFLIFKLWSIDIIYFLHFFLEFNYFCSFLIVKSCWWCAETEQGVAQAIIRSVVDFKRDPWPKVSDNAKDLVKKMLNPDPKQRLTAQEVLGIVQFICVQLSSLIFSKMRECWCFLWNIFINLLKLQIIPGFKTRKRHQMFLWVKLWKQDSSNFLWWTSWRNEL